MSIYKTEYDPKIPHPYQHLEDSIMMHRYLYYIMYCPIISDTEFDKLERNARSLLVDKVDSPVHLNGSELDESYTPFIKDLALKRAKDKGYDL